ncbi:MAG: CBS domain-containing protein [Alphaproteobacteria bacterium]|jgi:CBS domain-containing protein|nr:CBS domain-containing protein [Alphaproteobacteria bacterium]
MPERRISEVLRDPFLVQMPPNATVSEAAMEMSNKHVASIVVTEGNDQLDGIFTERDMIDRVIAAGRDPKTTTLADVMTPHPVTVSPQATVLQAMAEMRDNNLRHLPVADGGKVVGVVSIRDFVGDDIAELDHERQFARTVWETLR